MPAAGRRETAGVVQAEMPNRQASRSQTTRAYGTEQSRTREDGEPGERVTGTHVSTLPLFRGTHSNVRCDDCRAVPASSDENAVGLSDLGGDAVDGPSLRGVKIGVIGAGSWGTTFASALAERHDTRLWAREPEVAEAVSKHHENPVFLPDVPLTPSLRASTSLNEVIEDRELLAVVIPTQHLRDVAQHLAAVVPTDVALLSLAKGIEQRTLLRPTQIVNEILSGHDPSRVGVLSGPNLAHEVAAKQPSATVIAMPEPSLCERLQSVVMSNRFRVYTSSDVVGCEIGGAVKNVIAIAAGMADGLGYGWNTRAALITRGLAELTRLGVALGGLPLTFLGLAGNGDLIATCSSAQSRNRRVGVELGRGRPLVEILADTKMIAEGVSSAPAVLALAETVGVELPIATEVQAVLAGDRSPTQVVESLMRRAGTSELHDLPGPAGT